MPNSTENRGLTRRLHDWLYRNRASAPVWAGFVVFALFLAGGLAWGISWINERWFWGEKWFEGTGPWTFIVVVGGSPIAWFIWFVRDQNKAADIRIEDARNVQATIEHARRIFADLQAAAAGDNDVLQAAAIHQLATFILGRAEAFNPTELTGEKNPFAQPGIAIIRTLLDERSWETRWAKHMQTRKKEQVSGQADDNKEAELHRSPVVLAIEDLIRQHDFPTRDFSNWNLSGLILGNVWWYLARLDSAHLEGAVLYNAHLEGAVLNDAHLERAGLHFAHLEGAVLYNAHLEGADLGGAHLKGVNFHSAYLEGARIDRKWETAIDCDAMHIKGTPIFVGPGEDEETEEE